jgi:hypothetical protein
VDQGDPGRGNTYTDLTSAEQEILWAIEFKAEDSRHRQRLRLHPRLGRRRRHHAAPGVCVFKTRISAEELIAMRVKFTADPKLPDDIKHLGYHKDLEVNLSDDEGQRWIRRGVAQEMPAKKKRGPAAPETAPAAETPAPELLEAMREQIAAFSIENVKTFLAEQGAAVPEDEAAARELAATLLCAVKAEPNA